ncbi:MAG: tRNA pseudouridine(38-40) synthase TruA [Halobacteriaceae archaeon]
MVHRAFRLAYDGRDYHGYQRQPDVRTVAGALFDALDALLDDRVAHDDPPPGYVAAGRTDAGVSALAQTVSLRVPDWLDPGALSAELPDDVRAWAAADVPPDFHARHDVERRSYDYRLHAPREESGRERAGTGATASEATVPGRGPLIGDADRPRAGPPVDESRLRAAMERLAGEHDFHNLTTDESGTVRRLDTSVHLEGSFLRLRFTARGFPRQLVRRAVALASAVATRERDPAAVDRALAPEPLPGPEGVAPAPPAPLVLADVAYDGPTFETDPDAAAEARAAFAGRRVAAASRARVIGRLERGVGSDGAGVSGHGGGGDH